MYFDDELSLKFTRIYLEMAARGRFSRVSRVDRERLIEAFEGNERDYLELVAYFRTGKRETLARGGITHIKMNDDMQNHPQGVLDANLRKLKVTIRISEFPR